MGGKDWEMTEEEFRKKLVKINYDFFGLFNRYTNEMDAIEFQKYMVALYYNKDVDTSMMIMLMEKLRIEVYEHKSSDGKYGYYFVDVGIVATVFADEDFRNIVNEKSSCAMMYSSGIYLKNGRKLSLFNFRMYGRYLFQKYLGDDYAEEFSDYMAALLFCDDVETTVLYDMLCELRLKIALTGKGKIGKLDYDFICEMMECEEMMKIIEENSIIMDNDDE